MQIITVITDPAQVLEIFMHLVQTGKPPGLDPTGLSDCRAAVHLSPVRDSNLNSNSAHRRCEHVSPAYQSLRLLWNCIVRTATFNRLC